MKISTIIIMKRSSRTTNMILLAMLSHPASSDDISSLTSSDGFNVDSFELERPKCKWCIRCVSFSKTTVLTLIKLCVVVHRRQQPSNKAPYEPYGNSLTSDKDGADSKQGCLSCRHVNSKAIRNNEDQRRFPYYLNKMLDEQHFVNRDSALKIEPSHLLQYWYDPPLSPQRGKPALTLHDFLDNGDGTVGDIHAHVRNDQWKVFGADEPRYYARMIRQWQQHCPTGINAEVATSPQQSSNASEQNQFMPFTQASRALEGGLMAKFVQSNTRAAGFAYGSDQFNLLKVRDS